MSRENRSITLRAIEAMQPGEVLWDGDVRGFCIRFRGSKKVYGLKARIAGRQRWLTIGEHGKYTPETARKKARSLYTAIDNGGDPAGEREKAKRTLSVADVAARFLAEHCGVPNLNAEKFKAEPGAAIKPGTAREYWHLLRVYIVPKIGKLRADAVTTGDLAKLHHEMRDTPRSANHALACVSAMSNWSAQRGLWPKGANPCEGIKRFAENRRTRFLNTDETKRLVAAINTAEASCKITNYSAAALRFLLLTGLRPREALNLQWSQVDTAGGMLHLTKTKTGDRSASLSTHALQLLASLPRIEGNDFVFCGQRDGKPLASLQHAFEVVRTIAKLPGDVVLYTLRHNFGSTLAAGKAPAYEIMQLMGHRNITTSLRYIHLANEGVRATADRATAGIADALGNAAKASSKPSANVVPLSMKRGG